MRYLIIHAERKYRLLYENEAELLEDHKEIGRDNRGFPLLEGFLPPLWIRAGRPDISGEHLEYIATRPDEPDLFNTSAWEACP